MSDTKKTAAFDLRSVVSDKTLPKVVDVVVIGGGIIGAAATWHLAKRGLRVALCEKGVIGGEQSGRNWGWCRNTLRDPAEIPLMLQSMRDWRDPDVFGRLDTGFRTNGIMYFNDANNEASHHAWLERITPFGLDSTMLSRREIEHLLPDGTHQVRTALYTASDGCAEPDRATVVIIEDARRLGAHILTGCAVRSVEAEAGRLSAIVTEHGTIRTSTALIASGIWSRLFLGNLGIDFPQLKVLGSVSKTAPMSGGPDISLAGINFGWRKRADGGYIVSQANATVVDIVPDSFWLFPQFLPIFTKSLRSLKLRIGSRFIEEARLAKHWNADEISPFEMIRIADPAPIDQVLSQSYQKIADAFPFFQRLNITGKWGGLIDVTPDALPAIGPLAKVPGLFLASGFSGHGFGLGPGGGRLAADLITGMKPDIDATSFKPSRFGGI